MNETALTPHPLKAAVISEMHARPFQPMSPPRVVRHYAFMTDRAASEQARQRLAVVYADKGLQGPDSATRHHFARLRHGNLRFEAHSEFTTFTWDAADARSLRQLLGDSDFVQPGPQIVSVHLEVVADGEPEVVLARFDPSSLAVSACHDERALIATDFKPDESGAVHILIMDRGLTPAETGALVQRVLEIETYRTLALLGLPEAQRLAPEIDRIEAELVASAERFQEIEGTGANRTHLDQLTRLAAKLEAGSAASAFRFGASRAYAEIVDLRFRAIGERPVPFHSSWSAFLARRMAPAMRTCLTTERRQQDLSRKLARATALLRARVDVELFEQNHAVLEAMGRRMEMQLRLQQTVEGLSVAAISYYLVGLIGYLAKGPALLGLHVEPTAVTAAAVVPTMLAIWLVVRRIRKRHQG